MFRARTWFALIVVGAMGVVAVCPLWAQDAGTSARLKADVTYLASPALKGRETGKAGAASARKMIEARFKDLGLAKWEKQKNYSVPFAYGTNVVGVLPGSDPVLASEIVLVSAHYDHMGAKKDEIFFGASDNASGVAAILEAARQLSQPDRRPRRTVAFVAFDSEEKMMLGSFAFSLRPEVIAAKIVAMVNVDMLGRKFLDVVDNAVLVSGGEGYPALRESLRDAGRVAGLRVFPVGGDLTGPRSDHVPFQDRGVPALFFSCGTFRDYHTPADTVDRLDFGLMERSERVILATIQGLADGAPVARDPTDRWEKDELRSLQPVFHELLAQPKTAGIAGAFLTDFQKLESNVGHLLSDDGYDWNARRGLILDTTAALSAALQLYGKPDATAFPPAAQYNIRLAQYFYTTYPEELRLALREAIAQVLEHRPGLFRTMPRFEYEIYRSDPKETRLAETSPGVFRLAVPIASFYLEVNPRPSLFSFRSEPVRFQFLATPFEEEGSREALADYWLLRLRENAAYPKRVAEIRAVLRLVLGKEPGAGYTGALAERLREGGFRDESEWIVRTMRSPYDWLSFRAVKAAMDLEPMRDAPTVLIRERTAPASARAAAIETAFLGGRSVLSALCDVIDDPAVLDASVSPPSDVSRFPPSTIARISSLLVAGVSLPPAPLSPVTIGVMAQFTLAAVSENAVSRDAAACRVWAAKQPEKRKR